MGRRSVAGMFSSCVPSSRCLPADSAVGRFWKLLGRFSPLALDVISQSVASSGSCSRMLAIPRLNAAQPNCRLQSTYGEIVFPSPTTVAPSKLKTSGL